MEHPRRNKYFFLNYHVSIAKFPGGTQFDFSLCDLGKSWKLSGTNSLLSVLIPLKRNNLRTQRKLSTRYVTALRLDVAGSLPGSSARDIAITLRWGEHGIPTRDTSLLVSLSFSKAPPCIGAVRTGKEGEKRRRNAHKRALR